MDSKIKQLEKKNMEFVNESNDIKENHASLRSKWESVCQKNDMLSKQIDELNTQNKQIQANLSAALNSRFATTPKPLNSLGQQTKTQSNADLKKEKVIILHDS